MESAPPEEGGAPAADASSEEATAGEDGAEKPAGDGE